MAHEHTEECERLHDALRSLQAQQGPPRDTIDAFAAQVIVADRVAEPAGDTPEVQTEIARIRSALDALECDG